MQFNTPTTKEEMYATLRTIYNYYRIRMDGYTPTSFTPLDLDRITYVAPTDAELTLKAATLTAAKNEERKAKRKAELEKEIAASNAKLSYITAEENALLAAIEEKYEESEEKIRSEALRRGYSNSSVLLSRLAELESAKNAETVRITAEYAGKRSDLNAAITSATAAITALPNYYSDVFTAEKNAKLSELKDERAKETIAVNKYNSAQDEKEQKQAISVAINNAELQLKFLALQASPFTKEQLVEMGYYEDVLTCITGYFNTISSAGTRYTEFSNESKLVFYLEDYYPDVLYLYRTLAGL